MLQLDPAIPVMAFVCGRWQKATSHGWLDYGVEADFMHICFSDEDGEIWILRNKYVRAQINITIGRTAISTPTPTLTKDAPKCPTS